MPLKYDATLKDLVQCFVPDYEQGLHLTEMGPLRPLNVDVSTISAATDVALGQGDPPKQVVDLHFQSGPPKDLQARALLYQAAFYYRFRVPVHSVIVLLRPAADRPRFPKKLSYQTRGGKGKMAFTYEVIRLWRIPPSRFLRGGIGILPLALLCKMPKDVPLAEAMGRVVQQIADRLDQEARPEDRAKILAASYVLSGLRLTRERADQVFHGVQIMQESTTYQGLIEDGRIEGRVQEARKILLQLGRHRFGEPEKSFAKKLKEVSDINQLERLSVRLLDVDSWRELLESC